jgi:hypothetical protein
MDLPEILQWELYKILLSHFSYSYNWISSNTHTLHINSNGFLWAKPALTDLSINLSK